MGLHKTLRSPGRSREGPTKTISSELVLQAKSDLAQILRSSPGDSGSHRSLPAEPQSEPESEPWSEPTAENVRRTLIRQEPEVTTRDMAEARTAQSRPQEESAQRKHHQTHKALVQSSASRRDVREPEFEPEREREPEMNLVAPLAEAACLSSQHTRSRLKSLQKDKPSSRRPQSPRSPRTPVQRAGRHTHTEEEETRRVELQVVMRSASPRARSARQRFQEMEEASQSEKQRRRESLRMAATAGTSGFRSDSRS